VAKKNMKRDLRPALNAVLSAVEASQDRERVHEFLQKSSAHFVLGYDPAGPRALISYLREGLAQLNYCDDAELTQVSTALIEAISNAINHGNLELDSAIRESDSNRYRELGRERAAVSPYRERRVNVTTQLTPNRATFVVADEGPGFDPSNLPDPTDPANVLKMSGRGVLLMRTFMDELSFNERGNEVTMVKRPSDLR
jgi:anti-sigma regulatory factor (Ser/Thr protein kinase)